MTLSDYIFNYNQCVRPNSRKNRGSNILNSCANTKTSPHTNEMSHVSMLWLPLYVVTKIFGMVGSNPFSENFCR